MCNMATLTMTVSIKIFRISSQPLKIVALNIKYFLVLTTTKYLNVACCFHVATEIFCLVQM